MTPPITEAAGPRPDPARGVFETLLVVSGRAVELDAHLERLGASADAVLGGTPAGLPELVADGASGFELGRLRVTLAPGAAPEVRAAPVDDSYVLPGWEDASRLEPVAVPGGLGSHKWADRRLIESVEAALAPAQPLLVEPDGTLLETSRANVFLVSGGSVLTPPVDGRILPGVTRAVAMGLAADAGFETREATLGLDDLLSADEVFTTGAVRGIQPVAECLDARWSEGEVTDTLAGGLRRLWLERS